MTDGSPRTLRDRKKAKTRDALETAALSLFNANGFADTTVEQIAAAADVSPRTFARYFGSKEDAAAGHPGDHIAELRKAIAERPIDEPEVVTIRAAMRSMADSLDAERDLTYARMMLAANEPIVRFRMLEWQLLTQAALAEELARRRGLDAPDRRVRIIAASVLAASVVAIAEWLSGGGQTKLREELDAVFDDLVLIPAQLRSPPRQAATGRRN